MTSLALAGSVQATEYHHTVWDISTNQQRGCSHGLNGVPSGAVGFYQRDVYTETSIGCGPGWSGIPGELYTNLYLDYDYGTELVANGWHLGVGGEFYNGSSSATADYNHVEAWRRVLNVPTRFEAVAWTTYRLPLAVGEDFTSWPTSYEYGCSAYSRLHNDGLWHRSGLTCFGHGVFTTGVAPYVN